MLRSLPEWFAIENAIVDYVNNVEEMVFFAVFLNKVPCGFIAIKETSGHANEIYVMAVSREYQRQGIGRHLVTWAKKITGEQKKRFLIVKTLSSNHPDDNYKKTRLFYESVGFVPLEELPQLWGSKNPCLNMIVTVEQEA